MPRPSCGRSPCGHTYTHTRAGSASGAPCARRFLRRRQFRRPARTGKLGRSRRVARNCEPPRKLRAILGSPMTAESVAAPITSAARSSPFGLRGIISRVGVREPSQTPPASGWGTIPTLGTSQELRRGEGRAVRPSSQSGPRAAVRFGAADGTGDGSRHG
jgi:hypothetical protein